MMGEGRWMRDDGRRTTDRTEGGGKGKSKKISLRPIGAYAPVGDQRER